MPSFSSTSYKKLQTCHPDIITILNELIQFYDFSVTYGIRTTEEQQQLYAQGRSKLDGVIKKSKHQGKEYNGKLLSMAVDILPYAKGTNIFSGNPDDTYRFYFLAGMVYAISEKLLKEGKISHKIRWGGDWSMDMVYNTANEFTDLPHFELIEI